MTMAGGAVNIESLRGWIGRTESRDDVVSPGPVAALSATLDRDDPRPKAGDPLPLLWHWLFFLPIHRQSELGADGHARLGGFLPPVLLPRRMYAGGRIESHRSLCVGDSVSRLSRVEDVTYKEGRSGPLVFVKVRHRISNGTGLALIEDQDIVYREDSRPGESVPQPRRAPEPASWTREVRPDEVLLFRYSALTFNGHRIHYDRHFTTTGQGYPGLVVHGPLIATMLADLVRNNLPAANVSAFSFRAVAPLFDTNPFRVCGRRDDQRTVKLWAEGPGQVLAVEAVATLV
jgi:3-methylfumaryl-CoA hydratase